MGWLQTCDFINLICNCIDNTKKRSCFVGSPAVFYLTIINQGFDI